MAYSFSKISVFEQCPYKFYLNYINKPDIELSYETSIEAFLGDLVHRSLYKLYDDLRHGKLDSLDEIIKFFSTTWNKEFNDKILIVKKNLKPEHYFNLGIKYITEYYNKHKPFNEYTIIDLETQNFLDLDGYKIHIRIDKLMKRNNDYFICDYKTNINPKTQGQADNDIQLGIYALWVRKQFKDADKIYLVWHMLAHNTDIISERTDAQLEQLEKQLLDKIKTIENTDEFPTKTSKLCDYCIFKEICPAFNHEFELENKSVREFKQDQGVKLVDELTQLSIEQKKIKQKFEDIKQKLIDFSRKFNYEIVYGSLSKIKIYENIDLNFKDRDKIIEILKQKNRYNDILIEDTRKIKKIILDIEEAKPFLEIKKKRNIRILKKD